MGPIVDKISEIVHGPGELFCSGEHEVSKRKEKNR